ncbi:MAG TPA: ATP-binding protein [Candidatus Saccharimonadia bacterium]|nr:ATP-binding protein [Candidatus Saccharimonadia bacterium]
MECFATTPAGLYLVSGLAVLGLAVYLSRYGTRSSTIIWLRTFFFLSATYNISNAFIRCSPTAGAFNVAIVPYALVNALMIPVLIIFALHFINRQELLGKTWLRSLLMVVGSAFLYIFWQTDLFLSHSFADSIFQFSNHLPRPGSQSGPIGILILAFYMAPIVMMMRYHRHLEDPIKRKEVQIVIWALVVLFIPALIIEGIMPTVFQDPSYPVGPFTTVTAAIMVTYAITRYGLHVFNLNNVTGNVMRVIPGGLLILDHTNTIQYLNAGAAQMLGYDVEQLTGASVKKLFGTSEDYGQFQLEVLSQLRPGRQVAGHESSFVTKIHTVLAISLNATSVYSGNELVNRIISFTDISELKSAEAALEAEKASVERKVVERTRELAEAQAQLAASIRSLPFGFGVINHEAQIVFANSRLGQLMNHDIPAEPVASAAALAEISRKFKPAIDIAACLKQSQTKGRPLERNVTFGPRYYRFFFMPVTAAGKGHKAALGTVLLVEDVTEAKTLERSRDEFFSIASHELRTPLTAIRGNASMMLDYFAPQLKDPTLHTMVDDIHTASLRLIDIVNDFLDVSRLEMGKFTFDNQPTNMAQLVRDTLREYDVTGSRRKLKLELAPLADGDPWVLADTDRVRQVLINLLGNGLKATTKGGVTVTLEPTAGRLKVSVTDTGTGIPVDSQHLLFHKFQQAGPDILTRDRSGGTGLGLYISKLLAEGMHGRLYLEHSEVGQGSTFVLELPLAQPPKK